MEQKRYGFGKRVALDYEQAVERIRQALQQEGFGVLTEIDVRKVMHEKRGVEFRPYVILGACNPQFAHQALEAELDLGLLLPCNVVVYAEEDGSVIEAMDPELLVQVVGNPALEPIAKEVKQRLQRAIAQAAAGA
ncbi:hypothetical protein HRbin15_01420 [bacterium HR15]|nr:hypothetical protein HRbin15_01420 [bacterium HR15]